MRIFTKQNARVDVYTFKEGLLSSIAHDLRIEVPDFEIEIDDQIRGEIDLRSLRVACARKKGVDAPDLLSNADHRKIEATMRDEVLHTSRYPYAILQADLDEIADDHINGRLELHGEERDVRIEVLEENGGLTVALHVHQPDFGIRPYSAMLGSLKVKADVKIVVELKDFRLADLEEIS